MTRVFVAASLLSAALLAQDPPQRPTFRAGIDLVAVDVSVVDRNGRPVRDLKPGDFAITVDGRPRTVASVEFVSFTRPSEPAPPPPEDFSTNTTAIGGRLIMIVIDAGNIQPGRGRPAFDAVRKFVGGLNPADRVALTTLPGAGPQIDFTANHALVQTLLQRIVGQAVRTVIRPRVSLTEALGIARDDSILLNRAMERECGGAATPADRQVCRQELIDESQSIAIDARQRARATIGGLHAIFERLAANESPKTVIFISEGLVIDHEVSDLTWVGAAASKAHATVYVVQLDQPPMDITEMRPTLSLGADRQTLVEGLDTLAGVTRGDVLEIVAGAEPAFNRLALELSGYYLLSFEAQPGDRDGKTHRIRVDVNRKNVEVRARREFEAAPSGFKSTEDVVVETLRSPLLASDLPMRLTTYALQDSGSTKLKVLLATELDRSIDTDASVALGYVLIDAKGKQAASGFQKALTSPVDRRLKTQTYLGIAVVDPGVYTLKVAAVDTTGRRASVERSFKAQLNMLGQIHAADLLIADNAGAPSPSGLVPTVSANFIGDMLHGYIELYSDVPELLRQATVRMEVASKADGEPLDSAQARFQDTPDSPDRRRAAETGVPIALLPPGEYFARATVLVGGQRVGQVTRPFRVVRGALSARGERPSLRTATPIAFSSRIDKFDRASVLTPQVVSFFLNRLSASSAPTPAIAPALDRARAGRFADAVEALKGQGEDQLAAVFLSGLALFSKGELEAAAAKFRTAVRLDSEFLPAAFYLGACYAAGGRDREAAGAWQTSLITESEAPFIYTLLGDALLRLRDAEQAIDVLHEARTLWPDNDDIQMRLASALVLGDKPAEALAILDPYLARHPDDPDRLFMALRCLYEARAAGHPIDGDGGDRARFARYAEAYVAAKGPQAPIVAEWRRYMDKR
jgi:VWFA-related protein